MLQREFVSIELARQQREQLAAAAECIRPAAVQPASQSIRRSVGRSIMSIGAWLAAEPQPRLARSR